MFNVVITSLLPVTVYWFVLKIFHCHLLAFLTCVLSALEHHLAVFGTHTVVNSFVSPWIFTGLSLTIYDDETSAKVKEGGQEKASDQNGNLICHNVNNWNTFGDSDSDRNSEKKRENLKEGKSTSQVISDRVLIKCFGGFILGVVCYVRPDSVLFCVSVTLSVLRSRRPFVRQHFKDVALTLIGGATACMFCVADDFSWYGWGVISPIQWLKFNVLSGKSGQLFGIQDATLYLQVFTGGLAQIVANLTTAAILIICAVKQSDLLLRPRMFCAICLSFMSNFVVFSSSGHKEKRFIHNIIVLYLIVISYGLHTLVTCFRKGYSKLKYSSFVVASFLVSFAIVSYSKLPGVYSLATADWTYGEARDSVDANVCLDWLRRQNDVSGVYINASLYDTAGFITLKQDVPLLVKIHNEFYLYDTGVQKSQGTNFRIRPILNYSDYIHESNVYYLARLLSKDKVFNYVITKGKIFALPQLNYMYSKIFAHGNFKVFRTNFSLTEGKQLAETPPIGDNATVLEYEANWLVSNGLYQLATERISQALKLDKSRARLYQQMIVCYFKMGDKNMVYHYQEECFRRFGKQLCARQQDKVVLNEEYNRLAS